MIELEDFYNDGFGWICRRCERELKTEGEAQTAGRLLREGEAESKDPQFSTRALAKWLDKEQRRLFCPRCGISELADKA